MLSNLPHGGELSSLLQNLIAQSKQLVDFIRPKLLHHDAYLLLRASAPDSRRSHIANSDMLHRSIETIVRCVGGGSNKNFLYFCGIG